MQYRFDDALSVLRRTPYALRGLLTELPEAWTRATEGPGTWSPFEVVAHMAHLERVNWMPRAEHILAFGDTVVFPAFNRIPTLGESKPMSLPALLDDFEEARGQSIARLTGLHLSDVDLLRPGKHPDLGAVTLGQLLSTWVAHDLSHISQIVRVMSRQYRDEVGPWRGYLSLLRET